ncbi:hypothetical protein HMPREF1987_01606 [Peptostreptococcaceae bacterium oral taxon 113 str. W5053]|nr:hypothetical protein HMPREF1987_01606 [Peptostreptococcaceae bacterium oral taxon 113 str. W5053]
MNFIGRIIPVFIGWIIWRKTGHILIGALVAMFIETLTGPILNELQFLFVKKQNVQALNPFPSEQGKGMRVLIAKKRTLSRTPEQIVAEMKTELLQEENFNDLFTQVSDKNMPIQYSLWEYDTWNDKTQTKAIRTWRAMGDIDQIIGKTVKDNYFYEAKSKNGEYAAVFCFAQDIPISSVKNNSISSAKNKTTSE